MGEENAKREVTPLSDNALILKETFHTKTGDIGKQKLVHLYPDQLSWVSTHLAGQNNIRSSFIKSQLKTRILQV